MTMEFDGRGLKHPEPLMMVREHFRGNCQKKIEFRLLVDTEEYARTVDAFVRMSKCTTAMERRDGYVVMHVSGESCSCN